MILRKCKHTFANLGEQSSKIIGFFTLKRDFALGLFETKIVSHFVSFMLNFAFSLKCAKFGLLLLVIWSSNHVRQRTSDGKSRDTVAWSYEIFDYFGGDPQLTLHNQESSPWNTF